MTHYKRLITGITLTALLCTTVLSVPLSVSAEQTTVSEKNQISDEIQTNENLNVDEIDEQNPEENQESDMEDDNLPEADNTGGEEVKEPNEAVSTQLAEPAVASTTANISYSGHQQTYGNLNAVSNGATLGHTGIAKRLEAITIQEVASQSSGDIHYRVHGQTYGTQGWKTAGQMAGTTGQGKRVEAIQMYLSGNTASQYDIFYRVHIQSYGWMEWVKGGISESDTKWAGSTGFGKRMEAMQIVLVAKGELPATTSPASLSNVGYANELGAGSISYSGHQQTYGDLKAVGASDTLGVIGQAKRLEGIRINYSGQTNQLKGGITYRVHTQTYGWMNWTDSGGFAGTSGQAKRLEAVQMQLTEDVSQYYDIYYRVHCQTFGWFCWAKNGAIAGTIDLSKRMEAIQIVIVKKGAPAPTDDSDYAVSYLSGTPIMGTASKSQSQMVVFYKKRATYPSGIYTSKGASNIETFVNILYDEATKEGVKPEVVFAQSMLETGFLRFGGQVSASQCNFAGLGATDNGAAGATFPDVRTGLRAQVQHLKAYACKSKLNYTCVDPRFNLVKRGMAPTVQWLGQKENPNGYGWATGKNYGYNIISLIQQI